MTSIKKLLSKPQAKHPYHQHIWKSSFSYLIWYPYLTYLPQKIFGGEKSYYNFTFGNFFLPKVLPPIFPGQFLLLDQNPFTAFLRNILLNLYSTKSFFQSKNYYLIFISLHPPTHPLSHSCGRKGSLIRRRSLNCQ